MTAPHEAVAEALRDYMRLVAHLQRYTNPEEWETHGDWARLRANAERALAQYDEH